MPRILDYTEDTNPNKDSEIAIVQEGQSYKTKLQMAKSIPSRVTEMMKAQEFLNSTKYNPFFSTSSATLAQIASVANHPGISRGTSVGVSAVVLTGSEKKIIGGGEHFEFVFRFINIPTTCRFGFYIPTDRIIIEVTALGVASGECRSAGASTVTGTTYAMIANTWYRAKIVVNEDATLVTFYLYSEAGALLWSDAISTNIPTVAVAEYINVQWATASNVALIDMDYLAYYYTKGLQR